MHHLLRSLSVVLCAVSVLGSSQCQNNGTSSSPAFVTTMSVEDVNSNPSTSFSSGQTIQFVLSVRNRAQTKQTIYLQPCVNIYADVVFKAGTSNIAASFVGPQGGCLQLLDAGAATVIAAGQTLQYTYSWDQMGPDGQLVPPGNYEVKIGRASCRVRV